MDRLYTYLGDRHSRADLRGAPCHAVLRPDGRCVRGRGSMLVRFDVTGERHVVVARLLRKRRP